MRGVEITPRTCGLIPKRNHELDEERTLRLMQGCLSSLGALHGWFDFEEAWDGSRSLVVAQFEERGRRFGRMVREKAARRLPVSVLERPEVPGARWHLDRALVDRTRVLRGLTTAGLARRAHIDPAALSDMLRGRRRPTFGSVQAVCAALGLDLGEVIVFVEDQAEEAA